MASETEGGEGGADALSPEQIRALWDAHMIEGARYDDIADVEEALSHGADCNAADCDGRTALHMAAANGCVDIVRRLLAAGANTERANNQGSTALHWACFGGHVEVVRLLLQHGANPSALNAMDRTPVDEGLVHPQVFALFQAPDEDAAAQAAGDEAGDDGEDEGSGDGAEILNETESDQAVLGEQDSNVPSDANGAADLSNDLRQVEL